MSLRIAPREWQWVSKLGQGSSHHAGTLIGDITKVPEIKDSAA